MYATRHTVPTLIGQYNQMAHQIGQGWYDHMSTTINSKRQVATANSPSYENPIKLQYFGIGIRGSTAALTQLAGDEIPIMVPFTPSEKNMDLFHPIPVRMVPQDAPLNPAERAKYRMKTSHTAQDGTVFDVFWLKMVEFNMEEPIKFEQVNPDESRVYYDLDPDNLSPDVPTSLVDPENIVVSSLLQCTIAGYELDEVITHWLNGQRELACISEIGLYSGADFGSGTTIEAIGVQLAMHRCLRGHDLSSPNVQVTEVFALENGNSLIARSFE
jgi:hypothetical protein